MVDLSQLTEEQKAELQEKLKNMSPEELQKLQEQQCIFCQILAGKVPSKKIYEDDVCVAIIDINPAAEGHLLLLPKEHYAIMPQVPDNVTGHLFFVAQKLSSLLLRTLKATGTTIFLANGAVAGQRAQHVMVHIIPRRESDELFSVEEKLIDKELNKKAFNLVQERLCASLGLTPEQATGISQEKQKELHDEYPDKSKKSNKKAKSGRGKDKVKQKDTEEKVDEETEESDNDKDQEDENRKQKEVSLDDIANLFK